VREATEPLAAFLSLISAERLMGVFDAAPKEKPKEARRMRAHDARLAAYQKAAALQDVLDGKFGDPIALARGFLSALPQEPEQPAGLFPPDPPAQATLFAGSDLDPRHRRLAHELVEEARRLAREHRFLHWELAFPNVWQDWLSVDPKGGFDAVIGNPPYVRQEQIRALKPALKKAYRAFDGMADLYVYFYELGLRLLRPGGRLSYVVTNKWLRAGYAEELRSLLSSRGWVEAVADFGHAKRFFPGADVFPCVIVARRPDGPMDRRARRSASSRATWYVSIASPSRSAKWLSRCRAHPSPGNPGRSTRLTSRHLWIRSAAPACRLKSMQARSHTVA
jgi:SAM-dependent methyltransferase